MESENSRIDCSAENTAHSTRLQTPNSTTESSSGSTSTDSRERRTDSSMGSPRQATSKSELVNERISEMESVLSDVNRDESRFALSTENITELEKGPTDVSKDESTPVLEVDFVLTENSPSSNQDGPELEPLELPGTTASGYSQKAKDSPEVDTFNMPPPAEAKRPSNHESLELDSFELLASTSSWYSTASQETSEVDSDVNIPPPAEARRPSNHERLGLDSFELPASASGDSTAAQELPDVASNFKLSFSKEVKEPSSNQLRAGVNSFEFPVSTTSELSTSAKEIPDVESNFKMPFLTDVQSPSSIPRIPDTDCNTELAGISTTRDAFFDNFKAPSEDFHDNVYADENPPPLTDNGDDSTDPHLSNSEEFLVKDDKCSGLMGGTLRFFQTWLNFSICMSDSIFLVPFQVVLLALSLSAISMGLKFRHDCPALKEIPILILTLGFMGILAIALRIIFVVYNYISHLLRYRNVQRCFITSVNFVFLIMLSYELWTFFNFTPSFIPGSEDYCNPVFHTYAFILNCIVLFLVVLLFIMHLPAFLYYQFHMDGSS